MSTAWSISPTSIGSGPGEEAIKDYKKGDLVKAVGARRRHREGAHLARHQAGHRRPDGADPAGIKKGDTVTCEVVQVQENGIEVKIAGSDVTAFIRRSDLARDRSEQRPERFAVGEKVDARVIADRQGARKIQVSIKALEIAEEKEAVAQYGSSDSGASLGDILGAALYKAKAKDETSGRE